MDILPQLLMNGIIAGSVYSLLALGFSLSYGATRFFHFAHGVLGAIAGYIVFTLTIMFGVGNPVLASCIGILFTGVLAVGLEKGIYRPLRAKRASSMILLIASLGVFTALQALLAMIFSSQFQTLPPVFASSSPFIIFGAVITHVQALTVFVSLAAASILFVVLKKTSFGRAVRAVSDDEEVAKIVGIDTDKVIAGVFFISGVLAGLAGILVGFDTGIEPIMGIRLLLSAAIASIIGGIGSIPGALVGGFFLGFVENLGIWKIASEWKEAISFTVLILFLLFRPQGILGSRK